MILPTGTWTGSVKPANEARAEVTYDVSNRDGRSEIRIHGPGGRTFRFEDVELRGDSLRFIWPLEKCVLMRRNDGAFEGECALPDGSDRAHMVMVPPVR